MNNILNAQEAFNAILAGKNVLARCNVNMHGQTLDEDFAPISHYSADIFKESNMEYCIQIETIELAGITFTKPLTMDEVQEGQDVFIMQSHGVVYQQKFNREVDGMIESVMGGFAQRDGENAKLQYKAFCKAVGFPICDIAVIEVGLPKKRGNKSKSTKPVEVDQAANEDESLDDILGPVGAQSPNQDPQIEHNKDLIIDAIGTCVTAEEVETTCFGLDKMGFNEKQLNTISAVKSQKLEKLANEKATAENIADELLNQGQVDTPDPELSVLCDAFVDEINTAVSADEIKAIRARINSNGDLTEVESAELATRINLKSALFEKEQSHVSFDNIAAAAVAQAQKVDVETQQKNESGHYFDQVKKETAAWNEQLQKLLKDLETTKTPEEANSLVSQTMTWTKEQREPLLRAISRRLQHFQNPQAKENPSISVQIQNATDLTTLDSLEIDVSTLDPIIQPDMMRLITTRRLQLESAANDGGHAS